MKKKNEIKKSLPKNQEQPKSKQTGAPPSQDFHHDEVRSNSSDPKTAKGMKPKGGR